MPGSLTPMDEDDLQALLKENDGVGEFESETATKATRWLFPRFIGATDEADQYMSRSGIGPYDTDVETIVAWLSAPRNIVGAVLLLGEPGTGKTALIEAAVTHMSEVDDKGNVLKHQPMTTVVCTPDHTKDSLFLRFVGEGKGDPIDPTCEGDEDCARSPYTLGPFPYAAKYGHILYCDEAMLLVDGVKPLLYAFSDGRRFLPEGNVDGSPLEIHPDFRLVLSSNPMVRGASMPEPLASRCASTTLTVDTSEEMLLDLGIDESVVAAWGALKNAKTFCPQIREVRLADYWLSIDPDQAVSAFLPEHCPESQRKVVRDIVVGFLGGGHIRDDGRLVVS